MATAATQLPDWEVGPVRYPPARRIALFAVLAAPLVLVSVGLTLLGRGWDLGAFVFSLLFLGFFVTNRWRVAAHWPTRKTSAEPLDDPRFENLVTGLAHRIGTEVPELLVVDKGGPNALVAPTRKPKLIVTRALLETYTRTEQEAVAAHSLLRIASGHLRFTHLAALLGSTGSRFAPKVGYEDDVHAAALTRYPPGLAAAIRKAKPAEGITAPFWFVAHDVSHRHPTERIAQLEDL